MRLLNPAYYAGGSSDAMLEALMALRLAGTVFFVAGRLAPVSAAGGGGGDTFLSYGKHLAPTVPPLLRPMFVEIPESDFRADISSTQLRAAAAAASASPAASGGQ